MNPLIEQAIEWHARQSSGNFDDDERLRFQHWLNANPAHADAWRALQQRLGKTLAPLKTAPARQALHTPNMSRRHLLRGTLAIGALAVGARLLSQPGMPLNNWNADLRTQTAERRRIDLPGAALILNAQSAVDLDLSGGRHLIRLRQGSLVIDTHGADPHPVTLANRFGDTLLVDGRCMLELHDDFARVCLLRGRASIAGHPLLPGQQARMSADGLQGIHAFAGAPDAWVDGLLQANDVTLAQLIEQLRPYHRGMLQLSRDAAQLRISGVFSLDDSTRALAALADILPVRVHTYLGVWTRIAHA